MASEGGFLYESLDAGQRGKVFRAALDRLMEQSVELGRDITLQDTFYAFGHVGVVTLPNEVGDAAYNTFKLRQLPLYDLHGPLMENGQPYRNQ